MTCSAMQVRRLQAGEAVGAEVRDHVAACARCSATLREIEAENEALRRDLPFEQFAAGVAERLAVKPARRLSRTLAPLAVAAGLVLMAGTALVLRPADDGGVRSKGAASARLYVQDAQGVHPLEGPVGQGARLQLSLTPAGHQRAKVTLVEPGESTVLYDGPAVSGALPQAFEWTGGTTATLRVELDQEVLEIPLHR